jgi:hypothetical protein
VVADPNETKGFEQLRCENIRTFRNKKGKYIKVRINELESNRTNMLKRPIKRQKCIEEGLQI